MRIVDEIGLSYDDVLLRPQLGVVASRSDVEIFSKVVNSVNIQIPIISAPMSSVTDGKMARAMWDAGGFGIIHRFMTIEQQVEEFLHWMPSTFEHEREYKYCGAAIGINEGISRVSRLLSAGVDILCLDVAHAHNERVLQFISNIMPRLKGQHLIVGNIATAEAASELLDLGVDAVKVGIGPGAACTTRTVTGFGVPQLTAIMEVASEVKGQMNIIADGGIKNSGDIVKALAAGADAVMLGRLLAGAVEAPHPGEYYGMASARAMEERGSTVKAPEGVEGTIPLGPPVYEILNGLASAIKSGVSYGGGTDLADLYANAEFQRVTPFSQIETGTRI